MEQSERIAELESAIINHRFAVGAAYGIGSFKTQHAANMELWSVVQPAKTESVEIPQPEETGLVRPAMMEDTE